LDAFYYYLCLATPTIISRAINTGVLIGEVEPIWFVCVP
jgi:hypothetical protein